MLSLVDAAPAWGWADAVLGFVLAVCFCALTVRLVSWVHSRGVSPGSVLVRLPEQAPIGLGLILALMITLLVRGHPDQQVLVGLAATAVAGATRAAPPGRRRRRTDTLTASRS